MIEFQEPLRITKEIKTVLVGLISIRKKMVIKYLIRKENNNLFSVYESADNGYSARMIPRISCDTNELCYHESIEAAKQWLIYYHK